MALVATAANLGSQALLLGLLEGEGVLWVSLVTGTFVGLVVKYVLDKRFIFKFKALNKQHETQTFGLYSIMGIVTTLIFWFFELLFAWLFDQKGMILLGGAMGLALGYVIKYQLDKRFVFKEAH